MLRGTTPTHVFSKLPVLSDDIAEVWITYFQNGKEVLTKDINSVVFLDDPVEDTCIISVTLSQEETLQFNYGSASVQMRVLLNDETALASDEVPLTVKRIVKNGVISKTDN